MDASPAADSAIEPPEPERPTPRVRRMDFEFDAAMGKHWFKKSPLATHIVNGINLLFPAGERFFVRSVRHFLREIDDPVLAADARAFAGQEGNHAREHERYFELLGAMGYEIRPFLARYERFQYRRLEPLLSPELRLASTAAAEHFTAILAHRALSSDLLDSAHPTMRALLLWHACEEIEHKAVAFDVLQRVNPSYALRIAGLALATLCLAGWWASAVRMLLEQDGLGSKQVRRDLERLRGEQPIIKSVFLRGIREYVRRDFHPWQYDDAALARDYLASIGRGDG